MSSPIKPTEAQEESPSIRRAAARARAREWDWDNPRCPRCEEQHAPDECPVPAPGGSS